MKKIIHLLFVLLLLPALTMAQTVTRSQVPRPVKRALRWKFPAARHVEWKIKSEGNFEAEFRLNATEIAVKFDRKGRWLETESATWPSVVPSAVQDTIAARFKEYNIVETQTLQRWNEQHVVWEIHLEGTNEIVKAQFDGDGVLLSRSAKPKQGRAK